MNTPKTSGPASQEVRAKLVEAAGEVFARDGFRRATVREICEKAGANIAAVNYHFGGKEALYAEVLAAAHRCNHQRFADSLDAAPGLPPEARLRTFVRLFLERVLEKNRDAWQGRVMYQEMMEPTKALDGFVERDIRPCMEELSSIVRDLAAPAQLSPAVVERLTMGIVAQIAFLHHSRAVVERLHPGQVPTPETIDQHTDHIVRFCLGGIGAFAAESPPK